MNYQIHSLFPTPIYQSSLSFKFEEKHFRQVDKLKRIKNNHNSFSENTHVLNLPIFSKLKKDIQKHLDNYLEAVHSPRDNIKLQITQSWLNWTEDSESHHAHAHQNSFVSGVFYIQSEQEDKIFFSKDKYTALKIDPKEYNIFNAESWWFPAQENSLVLFPSSTVHDVKTRKGKQTRISLAFNTFIKGNLGNHEYSLHELCL